MGEISATQRSHGRLKTVGWIISILGMGFWLYGYFIGGGAMIIDWPQYVPEWAAEFVPNWQAEFGFALSFIGTVPLYYVEIKEMRTGKSSEKPTPRT